MKRCTCCRTEKPKSVFKKDSRNVDGLEYNCKICRYNKNKRKRPTRKIIKQGLSEAHKRHNERMSQIRFNYKILEEDLQEMLLKQQGCCAICEADFGLIKIRKTVKSPYNIDHDHTTGDVRGLLCTTCNIGIGYIERLKPEKTLNYLGL